MMVYRGFASAEEALNVLMYHTVGGVTVCLKKGYSKLDAN